MLIPGGIALVIIAAAVLFYLTLPEKTSVIRIEGPRRGDRMALRVISLDPDKPFDWTTHAGGRGRRGQTFKLNSHDANHLLILCRDDGYGEIIEHERTLTAGPSRLVTITVHGCRAIEVRSSPMPVL